MTQPIKRLYVLLEVEVEKDIPDLTDKVAQRAYVLDGVWNTTAKLLNDSESFAIASAWIDAEKKAQEGHQMASTSVDLIDQRRVVASHG